MQLDETFGEGQAEASFLAAAVAVAADLAELLEDQGLIGRCDPDAGIGHQLPLTLDYQILVRPDLGD